MWESHEGLRDLLTTGWDTGPPCLLVEDMRQKRKNISKVLDRWSRDTFGSVRKEIKQLKTALEGLRGDPLRTGPSHAELKIKEKLIEMYHREEIMWRQRARIEWLSAGDRNTKKIHLRASLRRKKNMIKALQNSLGAVVVDPAELKAMANDFIKVYMHQRALRIWREYSNMSHGKLQLR